MARRVRFQGGFRPSAASQPYFLIVNGPGNRPRIERFADAASYRARIAELCATKDGSMTIDEVASWLDADDTRMH